jgi:hypothetical protein
MAVAVAGSDCSAAAWPQHSSGISMVAVAAAGGSSASTLLTRVKSISIFDYVLLVK